MNPDGTIRKRRRWPYFAGAGILVLVAFSTFRSNDPAPPPANSPLPVPSIVAPPAASGPLSTFGNGSFQVGKDVIAGRYRSPAPEQSVMKLCYWDLVDDNGKIVDQGTASEGPSIATLKDGLLFKSQGCEDWQPA